VFRLHLKAKFMHKIQTSAQSTIDKCSPTTDIFKRCNFPI